MRTMYHLSPMSLAVLDPQAAKGKQSCIWLCTRSELEWAYNHVMQHQSCKRLYCHTVKVPKKCEWVRRWRRGIWRAFRMLKVESVVIARVSIEGEC